MPYEIMMYAALACAAISFTIALILFINLRIPVVIGDLTGSNARKEIAAMKDAGRVGNSTRGKAVKSRLFVGKKKLEEPSGSKQISEMKSKGTEKLSQTVMPADSEIRQERRQPVPVTVQDPLPEVTLTEQKFQKVQPAVFEYGDNLYSNMMNGEQKTETSLSNPDPAAIGQTIWISNPSNFMTDGTTVLSDVNYSAVETKASFTLIKHIVVINTQESIG